MFAAANDRDHPLAERFRAFVTDEEFPCVGAKAALNRGGMRFVVARDFRSAWDDSRILPALLDQARSYRADAKLFRSLVVLFADGAPCNQVEFERQLSGRHHSTIS